MADATIYVSKYIGPASPKGIVLINLRKLIQLAAMALFAAGVVIPLASTAAPPLRQYAAPTRIATMEGELLLVSDFAQGAVHMVRKKDLTVARSIAIEGQPVAVAWSRGRIFVGNETKGQVEAYNPGGKLVATFGEPGSIRLPNSIVILEPANKLLVLDAYEKTIKVFTLDGVYLYPLTSPGVLTNPSAMSFDPDRQLLLVSDFGAFSSSIFGKAQSYVQVVDLDGNKLQRFNLNFSRPQGSAVDGKGRLFVVDSFLAKIHILDAANGKELGVLGGFGSDPGQLKLPLDVLYLPTDGNLLVTDSGNGRIAVFPQGATP